MTAFSTAPSPVVARRTLVELFDATVVLFLGANFRATLFSRAADRRVKPRGG